MTKHQPDGKGDGDRKSGLWRLTRRNFAAAAAALAAGLATRSRKAAAHRRGNGHGGGHGGGWGGGNGGGHGHGGGGGGGSHHCFLSGTRISTPTGEVEVEALRAGDMVATLSGIAKPIKRIDTSTFALAGPAAGQLERLPVRIRRGALSAAAPQRDLYVSSAHALHLDGVLIPAGDLRNGTTIAHASAEDVKRMGLDRIVYFHIELDQHDVIFAEGAACETLRDDVTIGAGMEPFAPVLTNIGPGATFKSRMRSALSPIIDLRNRVDVIRDRLEDQADRQRAA